MQHILIADDHEVTRRGIRELLRDHFTNIEFVETADATALLEQVPTRDWDIILLDVVMPGPNILDVVTRIRALSPDVPILVLTAVTEIEYVIQTMRAGVNGVIHKHRAADELIEAIKQVAGGGTYLHPESAVEVARSLRDDSPELPHARLSEREFKVFQLIAHGRAIKEIAGDLALSDKTVATYLTRIREKTGLASHVDIARYAMRHHLID